MKSREIPRPQNPSGLYSHQQISPTELPTRRGLSAVMKLKEKGISAFIKLKRKVLRLNTCLTSNMYVNASQPRILSVNIYVRGGLFSLLHI